LLLSLLLYFALDRAPSVADGPELSPEHIRQAEKILKKNNPHLLRNGELRQVDITQEELDLVLNYSLKGIRGSHARVLMQDERAQLALSLAVPPLNFQQKIPQNWHFYLNC